MRLPAKNTAQGSSNYCERSITLQPLLLHRPRSSLILKVQIKSGGSKSSLSPLLTLHHALFPAKFPARTNHRVRSLGRCRLEVGMELFSLQRCLIKSTLRLLQSSNTREMRSTEQDQQTVSSEESALKKPAGLWRSEAEACF